MEEELKFGCRFGGGRVGEEGGEENGSRLRPNRNSIDLVRWCQAIHLAPSVRRRVFWVRIEVSAFLLGAATPSIVGAGGGKKNGTAVRPTAKLLINYCSRGSLGHEWARAVAALQSSRSMILCHIVGFGFVKTAILRTSFAQSNRYLRYRRQIFFSLVGKIKCRVTLSKIIETFR